MFCELVTADSVDGHAVGARLLADCGAMTPFVLEVLLAALLLVPHDHKNGADLLLQRGTFAYTAAVDGVVTAQLAGCEARAIDAARHFGMAALPARSIPTVAWSRKSARLMGPRFMRLGADLHMFHGTAQPCYCRTETPLHCRLVGCTQAGAVEHALASLLRVLEFEGKPISATTAVTKTSLLRWGVYRADESSARVLVVWSLVYGGGACGKEEQDALTDLWHSQLLYDSMHTLSVARASDRDDTQHIETWRNLPAASHRCTSMSELLAAQPFGALASDALVPSGRMCVLVSDAEGGVVPDAFALGKYAAALAGARLALERKRSAQNAIAYFKQLGAQRLCDTAKTLIYNELRQSMERLQRSSSSSSSGRSGAGARFGVDSLWQTQEYRRVEERISESRPTLERFFADLNCAGEKFAISGNEARIGGGLKLTLEGQYMLQWQEWRAGHNPQKGAGLGSLVWYCKQMRSADEALNYIKEWCSKNTLHTSSSSSSEKQNGRAAQASSSSSSSSTAMAEYVPVMLSHFGPVTARSLAWKYLSEARGLADLTATLIAHNQWVLAATGRQYIDNDGVARYGTALGVVSEDGTNLQRVFVDEYGRKRQIPRPKASLGPLRGEDGRSCGARVTPLPDEFRAGMLSMLPCVVLKRIEGMCMKRPRTCFLSEGPETALSVAGAMHERFAPLSYCTFGAGHMKFFRPPPHIERVVLCRENDSDATSLGVNNYADEARRQLEQDRLQVFSVWPETGFCDFNDMHQAVPGSPGAQQIRKRIDNLVESQLQAAISKRKRPAHKSPKKHKAQ